MKTDNEGPLFQKHQDTPYYDRLYAALHLSLFSSFLIYRLMHPIQGSLGIWIVAFVCEAYFAFNWIIEHNLRWFSVSYQTFLDRFANRYGGENGSKLPFVDIIITTADIIKESPILTMNTVLSVLAWEYPTENFACYVSDDGASPILYYSLLETSDFAKKWVPFCKKHNVEKRAPFVYFESDDYLHCSSQELLRETEFLKEEYETFKRKIDKAVSTGEIPSSVSISEDGFAFRDTDICNHSSIIKVIHEHSGHKEDAVPHIIYVSREKRPKVKHHYKAGAMNALTRVSGLMTNASYILNLDCDMFVNNPKVAWHAMCFFLGCKSEKDCGFVQFPQMYYTPNKSNPWGNHMRGVQRIVKGMNGLQSAFYIGTGCFHRRKVIYGNPPDCKNFASSWEPEDLIAKFGHSYSLIESAKDTFKERKTGYPSSLSSKMKEALEVSSCDYEVDTSWGKEIGWKYGSLAEDNLTSLRIHSLGWLSIQCFPEKPAFLGCPPSNALESYIQQRRWIAGLTQIVFSQSSPFLGWHRKLTIQQRLVYAFITNWGILGMVTLCYILLPIYSLLRGTQSLPEITRPDFIMGMLLFILCYGHWLLERMSYGLSFKEWWVIQRGRMIYYCTSWLFGIIDVVLEKLGLTDLVFQVTPKAFEDVRNNQRPITFGSIPFSTIPTTISLMSLTAIILKFLDVGFYGHRMNMIAEICCCFWTLLNTWPFLNGFLRKGTEGLPFPVKVKSTLFTLMFTMSIRH